MCVIYACWGKTPDKAELALGAEANSDGAGICWVDNFRQKGARVKWLKGLPSTADAVLEAIEKNKVTYPFAIHYRTASIGGKCDELTHPFPITSELSDDKTGDSRRVLMHNGHIADWKDWFTKIMFANSFEIPIGPWSDSRALAAVVNAKGEGVLDFVIGSSRVLVLDSLPSIGCSPKEPDSYFRRYGCWIKKDGWHQSCDTTPKIEVWTHWRRKHYSGRSEDSSERCSVPILASTSTVHEENVWTIEELENLVAEVKKEQDEARVLLGC